MEKNTLIEVAEQDVFQMSMNQKPNFATTVEEGVWKKNILHEVTVTTFNRNQLKIVEASCVVEESVPSHIFPRCMVPITFGNFLNLNRLIQATYHELQPRIGCEIYFTLSIPQRCFL